VCDLYAASLAAHGRPNDVAEFNADNVGTFAAGIRHPNTCRHHLSVLSACAKYGMRTRAPRGTGYVLNENPVQGGRR
jgi:hypothetical protein